MNYHLSPLHTLPDSIYPLIGSAVAFLILLLLI